MDDGCDVPKHGVDVNEMEWYERISRTIPLMAAVIGRHP